MRFSVRTVSLTGFRTSSKPVNPIVQREPLSTLCNHRISTCYPQRGVSIRARKNSNAENSLRQQRYTLPLIVLRCGTAFSARPKRKTVKSKKIAWEVLLFAKPFRNLCSRMRIPGSGINYRGLLNSMPQVPARMQTNLDTCSLVLDFKSYTRTCNVVQGGIRSVNSCGPCAAISVEIPTCTFSPALKRRTIFDRAGHETSFQRGFGIPVGTRISRAAYN